MADRVDPQITDSISHVNTVVLGDAPAQAMATLYQTSAASAAMAMQNAVHAQSNQHAINLAATAEAVQLLFTSSTAASAAAASRIDNAHLQMLERLTAVVESLTGSTPAPLDPSTRGRR